MRSIGASVALVAALLVGAPASTTPAGDASRVEPVLAARADALRRLAAPFPRPVDHAPRVLLVGDSIATTLVEALGAEARVRGAEFRSLTRPGCGLLPGLPTTPDGFIPPWARACDQAVPGWRSQIAVMPADVIVVLSTWDGSGRTIGDTLVDPATLLGHTATADLFRGLVDAIAPAGSGRQVVLLAEAIPTFGATSGPVSPQRAAEARHHRSALRAVARTDPTRVRVVDLGQWLCPVGAPCPEIVDGLQTRGADGGHFTPDGAAWLAPRLLDALGVAPA